MFLPERCASCGTDGPSPCGRCIAAMTPCEAVPVPAWLDDCVALLRFEGPAREIVARIKYRNSRGAVPWLAVGMADLLSGHGGDVVTWAPTTTARVRARGFDHAEVLARHVARGLGLPLRRLLLRSPGQPQTGKGALGRSHGPEFRPCRAIEGVSVVLVDDVITTGATMSAAGRALRSAGAASVLGLAGAHRPLQPRRAEPGVRGAV